MVGTYLVSSGQVSSNGTDITVYGYGLYDEVGTYEWTIKAKGYEDKAVTVNVTHPLLPVPGFTGYETFDTGWHFDLSDLDRINEWQSWTDSFTGIFITVNDERKEITNYSVFNELGKFTIPNEEIPGGGDLSFTIEIIADGYVTVKIGNIGIN